MFFFEPEFRPTNVEVFLSKLNLSKEEFDDLFLHAKRLILAKIIEHCLNQLNDQSDKVAFLTLVRGSSDSESVFNFISIKISGVKFESKFLELEQEVLDALLEK